MGKKSGKACKVVSPTSPDKAEDADLADPGKMAEIKAEQAKTKSGKYGSAKVKPHKPPTEEEQEDKKDELSWIEIELVNEENKPVPGKMYKITLSDDSVIEGTLDGDGFARHDGIPKGTCKITFPEFDKNAWEKI
jgi:hypothetical protein